MIFPFIDQYGDLSELELPDRRPFVYKTRTVKQTLRCEGATMFQERFDLMTIGFEIQGFVMETDVYVHEQFAFGGAESHRKRRIQEFIERVAPWFWSYSKRTKLRDLEGKK